MSESLEQYLPELAQTELFRGIDVEALRELLGNMDARIAEYEKDQVICRIGDSVRAAAVVLSGTVIAEDIDSEGDNVSVNRFETGDELGVYMAISGSQSPMRLYAGTRCRLLIFDVARLMNGEKHGPAEYRLLQNLIGRFAGKCADLYRKVRIFGRRRIRSRIRVYLMSLEIKDGEILLPMNRTAMAEWLGVDRAALTRELSRMEDEGLIALNKRRIRILDREYFQPETAAHEQ